MRLSPAEQSVVIGALTALADGASRRFEDLLWLGFGDRWTLIEGSLLQHNQVRLVDQSRRTFVLTEFGYELLARLTGVAQRAAG